MEIASVLAQQICVMFALMAVGYALCRCNLIGEEVTRGLGKLLLNVVIPVVIVRSFWIGYSPESALAIGVTFLVSAASLALSVLIGRAAFPHDSIAEFSSAFSNAGFIGIPLVSATFGEESVLYIVSLIALLNISQWTYGQSRLSEGHKPVDFRGILLSPMMVGCVLGVMLFITDCPKPAPVASFVDNLAALNTPLAMMVLGAYLASGSVSKLVRNHHLYLVSTVRLLLVPAATIALMWVIPCSSDIKLAILLAASAPTGANVAIFSQQLGKDSSYACGLVCMTTLLSLLTLPLITGVGSLLL